MHVHDNNGQSDEHLPIGDGTVDWEAVGQAIARDYSGILVIEGRRIEEGKKSLSVTRGWQA